MDCAFQVGFVVGVLVTEEEEPVGVGSDEGCAEIVAEGVNEFANEGRNEDGMEALGQVEDDNDLDRKPLGRIDTEALMEVGIVDEGFVGIDVDGLVVVGLADDFVVGINVRETLGFPLVGGRVFDVGATVGCLEVGAAEIFDGVTVGRRELGNEVNLAVDTRVGELDVRSFD